MKNPKAKGTRGELHVRDILRRFGYTAERNPLSGALQWLKGDIRSTLPLFIEVKNQETTKFMQWFKKANDQSEGKPPMIVWTKNNEDTYCFMRFTDFLMVLKGQPIPVIAKPQKNKKLSLEETSHFQFSKAKQTHRKLPY